MSYNFITGSTFGFSASVPVPVSGTQMTVASVIEGFQTLTDRTSWLSHSLQQASSSIRDEYKKAYGALSLWSNNGIHFIATSAPSTSLFDEWTNSNPVSENVTVGGQGITASLSGNYRASAELSVRGFLTARKTFEFFIAVNGTVKTESIGRFSVNSGTVSTVTDSDYTIGKVTNYIALNPGDIVTLRTRHTGSSSETFVAHFGSLQIERM